MAKEFVLGSVGIHDAAGLYQQAWDFYAYLLRSEKEADDVLVRANTQLKLALETKPGLVHHAEHVQEQALEISQRIREIRVQTLGVYVQTIGTTLEIVQSARAALQGQPIEEELGQFDLDLERIQERYDKMYAPFYDGLKLSEVREWGTVEWATFQFEIAGPVLLWKTISECASKWATPGVSPCHGPDYLRAWVLANQTGVALESDVHALEAVSESVYNFFQGTITFIVKTITDAAEGLVLVAGAAVRGATKGLGGWLPILFIGGVVAIVVNTRKK